MAPTTPQQSKALKFPPSSYFRFVTVEVTKRAAGVAAEAEKKKNHKVSRCHRKNFTPPAPGKTVHLSALITFGLKKNRKSQRKEMSPRAWGYFQSGGFPDISIKEERFSGWLTSCVFPSCDQTHGSLVSHIFAFFEHLCWACVSSAKGYAAGQLERVWSQGVLRSER